MSTVFLRELRFAVVALSATMLAACGSSSPSSVSPGPGPGNPPPVNEESLDEHISADVSAAEQRGCDWLEPAYCQFPWPNDHFTAADDSTATGKRLDLDIRGMPRNIIGIPVRPDEWNHNDGFSPGQMMLTRVDGLDLETTGAAPITDIEASLQADAPILVIDAETGARHPIWVEWDTSGTATTPLCGAPGALPQITDLLDLGGLDALSDAFDTLAEGCQALLGPVFAALGDGLHDSGILPNSALKVDPPALIMRPGINFDNGRRYIVAMRNLRDADGEPIEAPPAFRVYRDNHVSDIEAVNARREHFEDLFARLNNAGVARDALYMAWDFTVVSARNLSGRALHMRDEALEILAGDAPAFEILEVQDFDSGASIRRIEGRFTVPNYLNFPDGICDNLPLLPELLDYCAALDGLAGALEGPDIPGISELLDVAGEGLGLLLDMGQLPLSRLLYDNPRGEFPRLNNLMPSQQYRFQCEIPRSAIGSFDDPDTWVRPAAPTLYGHGLLGGKGEVGGSSTVRLRELNFLHCAIDWIGMATRDVPNALLMLLDIGNFPSLADRTTQGLVNWAYMARLLKHPDGLASHEAFRSADGRPVFDHERVFYDGNSQGGIMGGSLVATAVDIERASLGVPGMNYSTLLRRSVDFDSYGVFLYNAYPNSFDQSFVLSLIQNLWDRGEANGYAHHLARPDAFNAIGFQTPDKEVLLHVALGDHQVADVSAEVMTRTLGGAVHQPATRPDRHSNVHPFWGIPAASEGPARSTLVFWDIGPLDNGFNEGTGVSPTGNTPPRDGVDPHGNPRREVSSAIQRYDFLVGNRYTNVCGPRPCFARDYIPDEVVSRAAGNAGPLVRTPGPATAQPGGSVQLHAVAADPDLDALSPQWSVDSGADCVTGIDDADAIPAVAHIAADCPAGSALRFRLTVSDEHGGSTQDTTEVMVQ